MLRAVAVPLALGALLAVAGAAHALTPTEAPAAAAAPRAALVELGECAAPASLPEPTDARSTGDTVTSFQVVALVRLRVASGHLVAAATNTGCAPRPTDTFLIGDRAATEAETAAALASFRSGDWRAPGAWHDAD